MEVPVEHWLPVRDYEGIYEVSDFGNVRRVAGGNATWPGRILKPVVKKNTGYVQVSLFCDGVCKTPSVHRMVLEAFVGTAPSPTHQGHHKNGDKTDNRLENLEWTTPQENSWLTYADGRVPYGTPPVFRGSEHPTAKLTEEIVRAIKPLRGQVGPAMLAKQYGISVSAIWNVWRGKTWAHVEV